MKMSIEITTEWTLEVITSTTTSTLNFTLIQGIMSMIRSSKETSLGKLRSFCLEVRRGRLNSRFFLRRLEHVFARRLSLNNCSLCSLEPLRSTLELVDRKAMGKKLFVWLTLLVCVWQQQVDSKDRSIQDTWVVTHLNLLIKGRTSMLFRHLLQLLLQRVIGNTITTWAHIAIRVAVESPLRLLLSMDLPLTFKPWTRICILHYNTRLMDIIITITIPLIFTLLTMDCNLRREETFSTAWPTWVQFPVKCCLRITFWITQEMANLWFKLLN